MRRPARSPRQWSRWGRGRRAARVWHPRSSGRRRLESSAGADRRRGRAAVSDTNPERNAASQRAYACARARSLRARFRSELYRETDSGAVSPGSNPAGSTAQKHNSNALTILARQHSEPVTCGNAGTFPTLPGPPPHAGLSRGSPAQRRHLTTATRLLSCPGPLRFCQYPQLHNGSRNSAAISVHPGRPGPFGVSGQFLAGRAGRKPVSSWLTRSASSWSTECEASGRRWCSRRSGGGPRLRYEPADPRSALRSPAGLRC